jgi:hypothetical protein
MTPSIRFFSSIILTIIVLLIVAVWLSRSEEDQGEVNSSTALSSRSEVPVKGSGASMSRNRARSERATELPLEIYDWRFPESDKKLFSELCRRLETSEASRVVEKGNFVSGLKLSEALRKGLAIPDSVKEASTNQVTAAIRPPTDVELKSIYGQIDEVINASTLKIDQRQVVRQFFEDRFSLKEDRFKTVMISEIVSGDGALLNRATTAFICDEFTVEDFDDGGKKIYFHGSSEVENTDVNPDERTAERYSHLIKGAADN